MNFETRKGGTTFGFRKSQVILNFLGSSICNSILHKKKSPCHVSGSLIRCLPSLLSLGLAASTLCFSSFTKLSKAYCTLGRLWKAIKECGTTSEGSWKKCNSKKKWVIERCFSLFPFLGYFWLLFKVLYYLYASSNFPNPNFGLVVGIPKPSLQGGRRHNLNPKSSPRKFHTRPEYL